MEISPRLIFLAFLALASHALLADAAVSLWGLRARGLAGDALGNRPDPYVKVWCGNINGGRTNTLKGTSDPNWDERFTFSSCKAGSILKMEVWDQDLVNDDRLGTCNYKASGSGSGVSCDSLSKGTLYFSFSSS